MGERVQLHRIKPIEVDAGERRAASPYATDYTLANDGERMQLHQPHQ